MEFSIFHFTNNRIFFSAGRISTLWGRLAWAIAKLRVGWRCSLFNESTAVSVLRLELSCVTDEVYQQLLQQFSPFSESQSFGLDIYIQVVTFLASLFID